MRHRPDFFDVLCSSLEVNVYDKEKDAHVLHLAIPLVDILAIFSLLCAGVTWMALQ